MSQEIEIEYKSLLTEKEYHQLIATQHVTEADYFSQTNVYYDTSDFDLKKLGYGLRIRLKANTAELTLKSPTENQIGLLETTDLLSLEKAETLISNDAILANGHVAHQLAQANISLNQLTVQGRLITKRVEIKLTPEVLLVLDESWYHGKHDYELEMEVQDVDEGKSFFVNFLADNGLIYKPAKNKIERTIQEKGSS